MAAGYINTLSVQNGKCNFNETLKVYLIVHICVFRDSSTLNTYVLHKLHNTMLSVTGVTVMPEKGLMGYV